jgi:serine protease AprX
MKKVFFTAIIILLTALNYYVQAQTVYAYRVQFKNKNGGPTFADSLNFLTQKALDRRNKQNIKLDFYDLPIPQFYIDSVVKKSQAFRVKNRSKWFNQIVILTKTNNMANVVALPYVKEVKMVGRYPSGWGTPVQNPNPLPPYKEANLEQIPYKNTRGSQAYYGASFGQLVKTNTDFLHDLGFKGENMHVAFIDMGFARIDSFSYFDSLKYKNQIIDTWNFVRDTFNVTKFSSYIGHGTDAISTVVANKPGDYVGSAPNCNVSMYLTEDLPFESPIEEDNWVSAAERADSLGADLISTSLGYFVFDADFSTDNYTYANDFDGKTTLIALGHNMAVRKGIFCVSAMGNMGGNSWKYMITPGDADSTYSVGAMDSSGAFTLSMGSSSGPSADGQIKPDGIGVGVKVCIIGGAGTPVYTGGTSFSAPTIAGGITCLMQALPHLNVSQIRTLVQQTSSLYLAPSDSMGYGVPNFKLAYETGLVLSTNNFQIDAQNEYILYPNPSTNGIIYISHSKNNLSSASVEIIDIHGKIIDRQNISNSNSINVHHLQKGMYYARIINNQHLVVQPFCIH